MKGTKEPQFPGLKTLFDELIKQTWLLPGGSQRGRYTNAVIAQIFDKSVQHASYIRSGHRAPSDEQCLALAETMFGKRPSREKSDFMSRLRLACAERAPETSGDFLLDLAAGKPLKISSFDFPPFSGSENCLFESLSDRFLSLCGIKQEVLPVRTRIDSVTCTEQHLLLAVFDSPDRMLRYRFWRIPIRMTLGAIILKTDQDRLADVASALSDPGSRFHNEVRPIVLTNSVGSIHSQHRLKYRANELTSLDRHDEAARLAQQLIDEARDRPEVIPVIVVDEFLSFTIMNTPELRDQCISVFEMSSRRSAQTSIHRRETPQHYLAFAAKRARSDKFPEYMQDALSHFLLTEPETTANLWAQVAKKLLGVIYNLKEFPQTLKDYPQPLTEEQEQRLRAEKWRLAWEWVQYALHLDLVSIDSYDASTPFPWKPILLRARDLVHEHFARNMPILEDQAQLSFDVGGNAHLTNQEMQRVFELFDQADRIPQEAPADPKELAHRLQLALLKRLQSPPVDVLKCEAKELRPEGIMGVKSHMRSLQAMYELMGRTDPVDDIDKEIRRLEETYSGTSGRVLLAVRSDTNSQASMGVVFLDLVPAQSSGEAEIRFMRVRPVYRHLGVGRKLLTNAVELAGALNCRSVRVEILPELRDAIELVEKYQFVRTSRKAKHPGRLVFVRNL